MAARFLFLLIFSVVVLASCKPTVDSPVLPTSTPIAPTPFDHPGDPTRSPTETPAPAATQIPADSPPLSAILLSPPPSQPSGTVHTPSEAGLHLSHPEFLWQITLPADWVIIYDSGYELHAHNPDQTIFVRLQAQRWPDRDARPADAQAYVEHWRNFVYGDVFPLFAAGEQLSEQVMMPEKVGGPFLAYEFHDTLKEIHHLQLYASAGGPTSVLVTTWTSTTEIDQARPLMEEILQSFDLLEGPE